MMVDPTTGAPHTAHTTNPVPFVLVAPEALPELRHVTLRDGGVLGDVSPTILEILNIPQPLPMRAKSLLVH
jgi:2,3-bisphosphoglycerate-independent phosphoglycerate mutase